MGRLVVPWPEERLPLLQRKVRLWVGLCGCAVCQPGCGGVAEAGESSLPLLLLFFDSDVLFDASPPPTPSHAAQSPPSARARHLPFTRPTPLPPPTSARPLPLSPRLPLPLPPRASPTWGRPASAPSRNGRPRTCTDSTNWCVLSAALKGGVAASLPQGRLQSVSRSTHPFPPPLTHLYLCPPSRRAPSPVSSSTAAAGRPSPKSTPEGPSPSPSSPAQTRPGAPSQPCGPTWSRAAPASASRRRSMGTGRTRGRSVRRTWRWRSRRRGPTSAQSRRAGLGTGRLCSMRCGGEMIRSLISHLPHRRSRGCRSCRRRACVCACVCSLQLSTPSLITPSLTRLPCLTLAPPSYRVLSAATFRTTRPLLGPSPLARGSASRTWWTGRPPPSTRAHRRRLSRPVRAPARPPPPWPPSPSSFSHSTTGSQTTLLLFSSPSSPSAQRPVPRVRALPRIRQRVPRALLCGLWGQLRGRDRGLSVLRHGAHRRGGGAGHGAG